MDHRTCDPFYILRSKTARLRGYHRRGVSEVRRSGDRGAVPVGNRRGGAHRTYNEKGVRRLYNGASPLPYAYCPERSAADVGESKGFRSACIHRNSAFKRSDMASGEL